MKPFTLGAISGVASLALAVPVLLQVTSAASGNQTASAGSAPAVTQACVAALAARDDAFLSGMDSMFSAHKSATAAHRDALQAAAGLADDEQRAAAVKQADDDLHAAMETAMQSHGDHKDAMEAIRTACGDQMRMMFGGRHHGPFGMKGGHPDPGHLAEKIGLTEDALKAALDSGKTIEQIAEENGVTLPPRRGPHQGPWGENNGQ